MGSTASAYANRITVCVTDRHREFLFSGKRNYQVNMSDFVRRLLDRVIEADFMPPASDLPEWEKRR
jgi:hypothetical protein